MNQVLDEEGFAASAKAAAGDSITRNWDVRAGSGDLFPTDDDRLL
jgi:hypothetical protein